MRVNVIRMLGVVAALAAMNAPGTLRAGTLDADFAEPPVGAKPTVWWHWMGTNITREGVDRDLLALKEAGLGGALLCTVASMPSVPNHSLMIEGSPWPDVVYGSDQWWALMKHAILEGKRLGLEMNMVNCPGWAVGGGPWITPELSMQKLVWTEAKVSGPTSFSGTLPKPKGHPQVDFYRDIAVLAVPGSGEAGPASVVDITSHLRPDGVLAWDAPAGEWTLLRIGHASNGKKTHPNPDGYAGALEYDKLSAKAAAFHADQLVGILREKLGEDGVKALNNIHVDSYEAGPQNWTADLRQQFLQRRGYDPLPWLPVVAGCKVGGEAQAKRFEWDLAETISELFVENNFAVFQKHLHDAGLRFSFEPYTGPFDTIAGTAKCDLPMAEFWSNAQNWRTTREDHDRIMRDVTASAQALNKRIVCAEAFTGFPMDSMWTEDPAFLKPAGDDAFCWGVNQLQLHSWVSQPFGDAIKPGLTLSWWGTHFGRHQTWIGPGRAFFDYLARCSAVLQRGAVVRDFCTVGFSREGGDAISRELFLSACVEDGKVVIPGGRSYALAVLPDGPEMLPDTARKVRDLVAAGAVISGPRPVSSPSLNGYPECDREVAAIGREVWGEEPDHAFGKGRILSGTIEESLARLEPDFRADSTIRFIHRREGEFDVYFIANSGRQPVRVLASFRIAGKVPEFWFPVTGVKRDAATWWEDHGRVNLPLQLGPAESRFVVFRRSSKNADPVRNVSPESGAELETDANGAVVLRSRKAGQYEVSYASNRKAAVTVADLPAPIELDGSWKVAFAPGGGAPDSVILDRLTSWTNSPVPGVRYFSGTGTYAKSFSLPPDFREKGRRVILDLGVVRNLARLRVNGRDLGVLWHPPFSADITDALREGGNDLLIEVTNTWHNRLIGDEQQPADVEWDSPRMFRKNIPVGAPLKRFPDWLVKGESRPSRERYTFTGWNYFTKESPLIEAGLIGPVTITAEALQSIPNS